MLRIVVVDDEEFIRKGLREMILQLGGNYVVVAEAATGMEALEMVAALGPDLVITDIKMPKMPGNELVAELHRSFPTVEKIILSGYDDFQLVRDNFKNGVFDYLVKPIDKTQLSALLRQVEEKINGRKQQTDQRLHERIQLNESLPLLRERFLIKFLHGHYSEPRAVEKLKYYQINLGAPPYSVWIARVAHYGSLVRSTGEDNARIHAFIVQNIVEDTLREGAACATFTQNGAVIALLGQCVPAAPSFSSLQQRLADNLREYAKVIFHLAGGAEAGRLTHLKLSYDTALDHLQHAFYHDNSFVITGDDRQKPFSEASVADLIDAAVFSLYDAIEKGQSVRVREVLRTLSVNLRERYLLPGFAYQAYADVYAKLTYDRENMRFLFKELFGAQYSYEKAIHHYDTLTELNGYSAEVYSEAARRIGAMMEKKEKRWVEMAKSFIAEHLHEEITLHRVADSVFLNPNYLSDLFRKETGETFIDYVTRKRIEKAKEYLRHSFARSFEVAELVGYRDSAYFSKVFKKVVGMSPSEYRNQAI